MSQEQKEEVGFQIILDIIHWMESLDWEEIQNASVTSSSVLRDQGHQVGLRDCVRENWSEH
jgi:hypothetical protein